MSIQQQIQRDVARVKKDPIRQQKLLEFLSSEEMTAKPARNIDLVLAYAGSLSDEDAQEMLQIIKDEFGRVD